MLRNSTLLAQVPSDLTPGARHGEVSYTVHGDSGPVVEVLLRCQAFFVKAVGPGGEVPAKRQVRWDRDGHAQATWQRLSKSIKW